MAQSSLAMTIGRIVTTSGRRTVPGITGERKNMRGKRTVMIALLLFTCVAAMVPWFRAQRRQYALNRQLIAALKQENDRRALVLVSAGADPNTRYEPTPVPSLPEFINRSRFQLVLLTLHDFS